VALTSMPFPQFLSCFQVLISNNSGAPYLQRRLVRTVKTKIGMLVFSTFLHNGHDNSLGLVNQLRQIKQPQQNTPISPQHSDEIQQLLNYWKQLYNGLYDQLVGKFSSLFNSAVVLPSNTSSAASSSFSSHDADPYTMAAGYSNGAPAENVWQFFVLVARNASSIQKQEMWRELSPIVGSVEQTTNIQMLMQALGVH